ncbi:hypothetical protein MATL_G00048520 [Megalops atlanticus]|uniref:Serine/arginine repetitive matrix protein 1-like n=1 Tax=Megalops atlanticus TaxID=7932 RepID=A0A9D3QFP1_MEGAT|nr:hypothetical protein MATL_G00048520 [Megalops atlanticus]
MALLKFGLKGNNKVACIKMVRPYSGSPRPKHRLFSHSHSFGSQEPHGRMEHADHYGSHSRDQREFRGTLVKAPGWREPRGSGPPQDRAPHFVKRPRLMDEWREPVQHVHRPAAHWQPQPQGRFDDYAPRPGRLSPEPHRSHRRLPVPRQSHSPPAPRRQPAHSPVHGPPAHRRPSPWERFPGPHPGHRPPSPHHLHGNMRPPSPMAHHGPYRGPHRRPGPTAEQDRSRDHGSGREHSPGERRFNRLARGERWNGMDGFARPRSGERRFSNSPQRKSQEFHSRISYPERLSTEREARRHSESEREMEEGRRSTEFHQHHHPQERPAGRPMKRKHLDSRLHPDSRPPPAGQEFEHCPKRMRRETPQHFHAARGYGGRALSLKDKSRLLKGRRLRAASEARHKVSLVQAPKLKQPKPQLQKEEEDERPSIRKARPAATLRSEQPEAAKAQALKKKSEKSVPHKLPLAPDTTADTEGETETLTIKVDTRHTLTTHRISYSSPSDRQLSRDLVSVSRRGQGSRPDGKASSPWRDRTQKTQKGDFGPELITLVHQVKESFFSSHGNITLNERFSKLQESSSTRDQNRRYCGLKRQVDVPLLNHKTVKPVKIMGPPQRPSLRPSSPGRKQPHIPRRPFAEAPGHISRFGHFRRPLMASLVPRPSFQQKPGFKKSQSIMSKYRHLQALRHRGPAHRH